MGERLTWDQMVKEYPGKWVVIKNAEMDGGDILSGIVMEVKPDEEIGAYRSSHTGQNLRYRRTTEEYHYGIINSNFTMEVD